MNETRLLQSKEQKFWSLFSGGKDSIATAYYLAETGRLSGLVFLQTGIGTHDILPHVRRVAEEFDWSLEIYQTDYKYEDLVLKYGFPSAEGSHQWFMSYLKGRGVRQFRKAHPGEMLASGVRIQESNRRGQNAKESGEWEGVKLYAPLLKWTTEQVWKYVREAELPISPCYQALHFSGDCLCGAYAEPNEMELLRAFYPTEYQRLQTLENRLKGLDLRCKWGGANVKGTDQTLDCWGCIDSLDRRRRSRK
jgi:3'-phosphoadenosine 5'-phosphosulfate sulfotransferase (PAPS reductase)/FAD synthetase